MTSYGVASAALPSSPLPSQVAERKCHADIHCEWIQDYSCDGSGCDDAEITPRCRRDAAEMPLRSTLPRM